MASPGPPFNKERFLLRALAALFLAFGLLQAGVLLRVDLREAGQLLPQAAQFLFEVVAAAALGPCWCCCFEVELEELVAMTRLGCQWDRQPIAALPSPVAELP